MAIVITPGLPPAFCPVGHFAGPAGEILSSDYGLKTGFVLTKRDNLGVTPVTGLPHRILKDRSATSYFSAFCSLEEAGVGPGLVIHFSQYYHDERGLPRGLTLAVARWKERHPEARMVLMIHELWLPEVARRRELWLYPAQLMNMRRFLRLADRIIINNEVVHRRVLKLFSGASVVMRPVPSNFGEPSPAGLDTVSRHRQWIIFGSTLRILRSLQSFAQRWRTLAPGDRQDELLAMGGLESREIRECLSQFLSPSVYLPDVAREAGSRLLLDSRFSFIDYHPDVQQEPTLILKSGVLAACLAHGVIPVVPEPNLCPAVDGDPIPGIVTWPAVNARLPAGEERAALVRANAAWYWRHSAIRLHTDIYAATLADILPERPAIVTKQ